MSLIALTDRLHAGRTVARTLLLLIAGTGAVIVGLLAMHSRSPGQRYLYRLDRFRRSPRRIHGNR